MFAIQVVKKAAKRCARSVLKGAPPEPCDEVQECLSSYKINKGILFQMYDVFHFLKQFEDLDEVLVNAHEVELSSIKRLVVDRRKWVLKILMQLLALGDCEDKVTWDQFLWIFVRFCSLNRVELGQALFLVISNEMSSTTLHYLDARHLQEFYNPYKDCPVRSFNTQGIDFEKLPLTRYYATDFTELTQRFTQLVNPIVYLQRVLQSHLPGVDFWDRIDRADAFVRKISYDFFRMDTGRIHLRGEPPYRETCDMLISDALGAVVVNEEQWVLRTSKARAGKGLRQVSVWGEQPAPELIEKIRKRLEDEAEAARLFAIEQEQAAIFAAEQARKRREQMLLLQEGGEEEDAGAGEEDLAGPPKEAWVENAAPSADQGTPVLALATAAPPPPPEPDAPIAPRIDARALSIKAATLDEADLDPSEHLPPGWMKGATVAPAPWVPNWGPLKPRPFGRDTGVSWGTVTWGDHGSERSTWLGSA